MTKVVHHKKNNFDKLKKSNMPYFGVKLRMSNFLYFAVKRLLYFFVFLGILGIIIAKISVCTSGMIINYANSSSLLTQSWTNSYALSPSPGPVISLGI